MKTLALAAPLVIAPDPSYLRGCKRKPSRRINSQWLTSFDQSRNTAEFLLILKRLLDVQLALKKKKLFKKGTKEIPFLRLGR